jgi:Domain of unknown function (DUF4249)
MLNTKLVSTYRFFILLFSVAVFYSCEKVIDLKIDEASLQYVIEGTLSNSFGDSVRVSVSQTKQFNERNDFVGISGASVDVQVNSGLVYRLKEVSPGVYSTKSIFGKPGNTYTLSVSVAGKEFTATSVMTSKPVTLDGLSVQDLSFGGSNTKTINPDYVDPIGTGNSYRFIEFSNGVQVKKVFVQDDAISDGLRITRPLINTDGDLKSGDVVTVEMQCIDKNVYKYWYSLDQAATGANQSATPANPVSNITGGALGYFSAHTVTSRTITIP